MLNYSNLDPPWDEWFDEKLDRNEIDPKTGELVSARKSDLTCLPSSWRTVYGLEARDDYGKLKMTHAELYIDAMYCEKI